VGNIQHNPPPSVFDMTPSHQVIMKADVLNFSSAIFEASKIEFPLRIQIFTKQQKLPSMSIFEPWIRNGNLFLTFQK